MSFFELAIVIVIALIVLGPQQLLLSAYKVGTFIVKMKNLSEKIKDEINEQVKLDDLEQNTEKAKQADHYYKNQAK